MKALGRSRMRALLALTAAFLAGAVAGDAVDLLLPHRDPGRGLPPPLAELGLSQQQVRQVRQVLAKHRPAIDAVVADLRPKLRALQRQVEQEINALLTSSQQRNLRQLKSTAAPPPLPGS